MATADRETTDREPETPRGPGAPALPNARLNPLLNPLLAKQLGRWAHIYYTASADKREAAIEKLVCELEAEEAQLANGASAAATGPAVREAFSPTPVQQRTAGPVLVTPPAPMPVPQETQAVEPFSAQHNEAQHNKIHEPTSTELTDHASLFNDAVQAPDTDKDPIEERVESILTGSVPIIPNPAQPDSAVGSWQDLARQGSGRPVPEEQPPAPSGDGGHAAARNPEVEAAPVHSTSINSDAVELTPISQTTAEDYRAFDELLAKSDAAYAETTNVQSSATGRWRIPLVAGAVLAVVAGLVWLSQSRPARPEAPKPAITAQKANPSPPVSAAESVPQPHSTTPPAAQPLPQATTPPPVEAASKPAGHDVPLSQPVVPGDAQPPDPELAAGMRALQGNGVPRDSAEAARHLWQSVKKENGEALVVLAGLYAQGDGVAKDCDQARILLDAAAKQAKSHTQFQHVEIARETMRTSGCQ